MIKVKLHIEELGFVDLEINSEHSEFKLKNGEKLSVYYDKHKIGFISMYYYIVYIDKPLKKLKNGVLEVSLMIDMTPTS